MELLGWRWRSSRRRAPQEDRVEGGGALSPLPFGARRRRQEARTKSPKLDPASPPSLRSLHLSFATLVWFDLSQILVFTFMSTNPRKYHPLAKSKFAHFGARIN